MQEKRGRQFEWTLFALLIVSAVIYRLIYLNHPFQRDPEGCGSFYGLVARNYLLWPFRTTLGVMVESLGHGHGAPWFYPNHPPLLPLLIWLVFAVAGAGEWQTRLSSSVFTIACGVLIYFLIRHRGTARAALLAAFFFLASPMAMLFGGQPDVINSQLVFFVLLTIVAYLHFQQRPSVKSFAWMIAAFIPAAWTDWPAFYLPVVLGVHFVFTHSWRPWTWMAVFAVVCVVLFAIPYGQGIAVTHDLHWMGRFVERRTISTVGDSTGSFTATDWFRKAILQHAYQRHNGPILPLMLIWIGVAFGYWRRRPETLLITLALCWAAVHVIVGRQGVYVHEWWWWPLTPGAAMAAGVVGDGIWSWIEQKPRRYMRGSNSIIRVIVVALLIAFATLNVINVDYEWKHPNQITRVDDPLNYSLAEIGQVIRQSAPSNTAVALGESDPSLAFWYYADRPLMQNIYYPQALLDRIAAHETDIPFAGQEQEWTGAVSAYILPRAYVSDHMQPMIDYLDARYPHADTPKFLVWKLH